MTAALEVDEVVRGRETRRRKRSDSGSVCFSERDGRLLELVGEQYAVSVAQLARLIGRTDRTGRWLRDRWRQAGWIESRPLTRPGPSFLWLTPLGVRVAPSPYRTWRPNASMVGHIEAVTDVRILLEPELRLGDWICERSLAQHSTSRSQDRPHLPDGLLDTGDEQIAIEVELSLKSRSRLAAILEQLGQEYPQVWYFAAPPLRAALTELAAEAPWQNITVYSYPPRPSELVR
jgi:hypothetical protein